MGWFTADKKQEEPAAATSLEGTYKPMRREERQRCWEARDAYYRCLDKHHILDSLKESDAAAQGCPKEGERFEQNCAASWVKYFKQKRVADYEKDLKMKQLEAEGAVPISEANKPKWKFW